MPRFGYHIDPPLGEIPRILADLGADTFQTTLRNPQRLSKESIPNAADQEAYLAAAADTGVPLWGMAHASLLTNLCAMDPHIRHGSVNALVGDANLAASLGLSGVCFHIGYAKGHASRVAAMDAVAVKLTDVLAKLQPGAQVWLENGCEGTELGQTVEEVGYVVNAVLQAGGDPDKLGVVLDTCHLFVAGFDLTAPGASDRLAADIETAGLIPYLRALHLNDAREPCGSHRDRHAAPGQGNIGEGLRRLCAYPLFAPLPAVLELGWEDAAAGIAYLQATY